MAFVRSEVGRPMGFAWSAKTAVAVATVLSIVAAGCTNKEVVPEEVDPVRADSAAEGDVVRFVALGDTGTGQPAQFRVANAIADVCAKRGCEFAVSMGDNIYESGVASAYDPQFESKFETPYAGLDFPFYMSLGNHDNGGTGDVHAIGDFQVDYHYRTDRPSEKWNMPSRWYDHVQGPVHFLAMDTNIIFDGFLAPPTSDPNGVEQAGWFSATVDAIAPGLDGSATASLARPWVVAYGHHPIYSNGQHGDAVIEDGDRAAWLHEQLCSGGVDLVLGGHDHDLQWLAPHEECPGVEIIVSGAAAKQRPLEEGPNEAYFAQGDVNGFWWMEVSESTWRAVAFDDAGTVLFERAVEKSALRALR